MRIAMAADRRAGIGGIETHIATLAETLAIMGFRVCILFPQIDVPQLFADCRRAGAILIEAKKDDWPAVIKEQRCDIFHAHSAGAATVGVRLAAARRAALVITVHGPGQRVPAIPHGTGLIFVSGETARQFSPAAGHHALIQNGINLDRFSPRARPPGPPWHVVYLGRVGPTKRKGVRAVQEALSIVPGTSLRFAATWTPDGRDQSAIHVASMLSSAHIVFSTGRGVREALASGAVGCVLGAAWDGLVTPSNIDRLADYNFSGRYHRSSPDAATIHETVRRVLANPSRLRSLQAFGRTYALRHWCSRTTAQQTVDLYRSVLNHRP